MREENRKRFGVQNIAVDLIRESRDSRCCFRLKTGPINHATE